MKALGSNIQTKQFTLNLAQAAATYDITTATGDVLVTGYSVYVATAGATFTSVAIQTNDTTPFDLMTSVEGAVANLTAGKNMKPANNVNNFMVASGKKLQFTIVGSTGTGSLVLSIAYIQLTGGL